MRTFTTYADVTGTGVWIDAPGGPVTGPVTGYDHDTEDADDNRPAILAALAALGWEPVPGEEWVHIEGGADNEAGATRIIVQQATPTTNPAGTASTHLLDLVAACLDDAQGPHGTLTVTALPLNAGWLIDATSLDGAVRVTVRPDGTATVAGDPDQTPLTGAALTIAAGIITAHTGVTLPDKS